MELKLDIQQINALVLKDASTKIASIKPYEKNLEIKFIVLEKIETFRMKDNRTIHRYLVADRTASAYLNMYDQFGEYLQIGDIVYANGVYSTIFKDQQILYQGKFGLMLRLGEFFFEYQEQPNVSLMDVSEYLKQHVKID